MSYWLIVYLVIATLLFFYVIYKFLKDKKFGVSAAIGILGIVIPIVLYQLEQSATHPTLTPTFTPVSFVLENQNPLRRDIPVSIAKYSNDNIQRLFPEFPLGENEFNGTRFLVFAEQSKVSTRCANRPDWPETYEIAEEKIIYPESVHILLAAGYAYADFYEGAKIGEIELLFDSGEQLLYELILGKNIREWRFEARETVIEVTNADDSTYLEEAYRGIMFEGNEIGILDMLTLKIPTENQEQTLVGIRIRDVSMQEVNSDDPCFHFVAITVKARR